MNRKRLLIDFFAVGWLFGASCAISLSAQASDGGGDPRLVTDAAELLDAGFESSATNVYTDGTGHYFELLTESDGAQTASDSQAFPKVFGTTTLGHYTVSPAEMMPKAPFVKWDLEAGDIPSSPSGARLVCPISDSGEFLAPVHLPQGVLIKTFKLYGHDDDTTDPLQARFKKVCQSGVENPVIIDLTADVGTTIAGAPANFVASETNIDDTVDNKFCHYHVVLDFEDNDCVGANIVFYKAVIEWQRQVSPAPASATFNDVPMNHTFFQEIEALAAAGITGGCGPSVYCPGDFVTRGQMAAFLARALGLHGDGY